MRRRVIAIAIVALVVGVVAGGHALYRAWAARRPLEWSGTIEAHTIDVGTRVGGRVIEVRAREGDLVDGGQVLVVLEADELSGLKLEAEGGLQQAQATLERLVTRGEASARQREIAAAAANLRVRQAMLDQAKTDLERAERLFAGGALARAELDTARATHSSAVAQRAGASAQLEQLEQATGPDVKAARGQVLAAQGRVEQLGAQQRELTVASPAVARVESLDLRPGDLVLPNGHVARLLEPGELFVRIYVPETQLGQVRPGLELPLWVDSFPRRAFRAVVESVRHEGEFTPRNLQTADERANQVFAARLRLEDGEGLLRAGMAATVRVER